MQDCHSSIIFDVLHYKMSLIELSDISETLFNKYKTIKYERALNVKICLHLFF